jgi:ribosome-associated toxin RatA of RatAB toxin-antitoxin module
MEVRKTLLVGHSAARMFDLIEAAENYPEFLPWCAAATIIERNAEVVAADITVDYHGVRFHFRTRNPKRPPEWMAIRLEHGPFHHFEGEWNLKPLAADGCRIDFLLRYDFKRGITGRLAAPVFERIANTLVDAFVARADGVYAGAAAAPPPAATAPVAPPGAASPSSPTAPTAPPPSAAPPLNAIASAAAGGSSNRSETP